MKRLLICFLVLSLALVPLTGCQTKEVEKPEVTFVYMEGVTALTVGKLLSDNNDLGRVIKHEMLNSPELLAPKIMKGEADIAIVPSNLAAIAYNKELGYKIAATSTWGNFYIAGFEKINELSDLKQKELYSFGKGLTPELVLNLVLEKNGIDADSDLTVNYVGAATEIAPLLLSGKADYAVLPEPALSAVVLKNSDVEVLFNLNELWAKAENVEKGYPQATLIVKESLIKDDPKFVERFLLEYEKSLEFAKTNKDELCTVSENLKLGPPSMAVQEGFDRLSIGSTDIEASMPEYMAFYNAIFDFNKEFIGGKVPDEEIFYKK